MKNPRTPNKKDPYEIKILVKKADELRERVFDEFKKTLSDSKIGSVKVMMVKKMTEEDMSVFPTEFRESLYFSGSIIVDAGLGIGGLLEAAPLEEQLLSTNEINKALLDSGLIQKGYTLKTGASATPIAPGKTAEVIESMLFKKDSTGTVYFPETKMVWTDEEGGLHISDCTHDERILLEHTFLVRQSELEKSNALALKIDVERENVDIYKLIAQVAESAGLKEYTIRCTIRGGLEGQLAVIQRLSDQPLKTMEEVKRILAVYNIETESNFYSIGTRSEQAPRRNKKWGEITGNDIYAPEGHHHGYSSDLKVGGHVLSITPKIGATVYLIIEPARVAEVVKK